MDRLVTINLFLIILGIDCAVVKKPSYSELKSCNISSSLADEIASYNEVVQNIIDYVVSGPFKGRTYDELANFVDTFGPRVSGSQSLEDSIDHMIQLSREEGLNDITTEELVVPHWTRKNEKVTMLRPRKKNIAVIGLGSSVNTPPEGIKAEVEVVSNFMELDSLSQDKIKGKIVLFDFNYTTYSETAMYRVEGASKAAAKGAVASLVRSLTPFSLYTPHTGYQSYENNVQKIPTAAITVEDSQLIRRLISRGKQVVLHIMLESDFDKKTSRNTLIDLKGTKKPEKLVVVSGHIDSWDVGEGALDDGGGLFISWAALVIMKHLNLTPKRTVRAIFWTAEEVGLVGAQEYEKRHRNESDNLNFVMESDDGNFAPLGLSVAGTKEARCIISEVLKLFTKMNASTLIEDDYPGSDINVFAKSKVPLGGLYNDNGRYFWYHHTEADTMTGMNSKDLDMGAAFWAAVSYVIADMSVDIPR